MQVCGTIVPALHLANAVATKVVVLVLLGLPIALVLTWAFVIIPKAVKRAENVPPNKSITDGPSRFTSSFEGSTFSEFRS